MPRKKTKPAKPSGDFTSGILDGDFPQIGGPFSAILDTTPTTPGTGQATKPPAPPEYDADGNRRRIGLTTDPRLVKAAAKKRLQRIGRERAALEQIQQLPGPGEELLLILTGRWHGIDLVGTVLELSGEKIRTLQIATLGFNGDNARHLAELYDRGDVARMILLVAEAFRERNREEYAILRGLMDERGQTMNAARNHAKILLFELESGTRISAHGSLNLRRCNSFEQLTIQTDPAVYEFFSEFIHDAAAGLQV